MGLMQTAAETYDALAPEYAGVVEENRATMAPVSHILTNAQIEVTLDQEGNFLSGKILDKSEPKVVIPVTEESAGRTSSPCAHPLCDQLGYIAPCNETKYRLYIDQLTEWEQSDFKHPILKPVLAYVLNRTIVSDLSNRGLIKLDAEGKPENEKMLVRWKVVFPEKTIESWRDLSLFDAFISFYREKKKNGNTEICMLSGEELPVASQHPKGIIPINGNAKLISANDSSGFTFRGRFENDEQALTVSYEMSQKAHNALRWLAADQGVRVVFGGRTFLCWNPHGKEVASVMGNFSLPDIDQEITIEATDYRRKLEDTLKGFRSRLPETEKVVIAAFDAATTGRLALTYYNELLGSDYLERLYDWDLKCCWSRGKFGIQSPSLIQIVNYAFGVQREEKGRVRMKADDKVVRQQMQRLISCRIDRQIIPEDIVQALVNKASAPQAYEDIVWRGIVFTACAVLNKHSIDRENRIRKGVIEMGWTLDRQDRSFQYGRLLAAMEKVEQDYYYQTRDSGDDSRPRMTTAIKNLSNFRQRPLSTSEKVRRHLWQAYIPRINQGARIRYEKLVSEIMDIIAKMTNKREELDKPLDDVYLLGYDLQRSAFFQKNNGDESVKSEEYDI